MIIIIIIILLLLLLILLLLLKIVVVVVVAAAVIAVVAAAVVVVVTEIMVFASPRVKLPVLSIAVGAKSHQPAGQVRNLGLTLYIYLTMEAHIKQVYQVSYFQLKTIRIV